MTSTPAPVDRLSEELLEEYLADRDRALSRLADAEVKVTQMMISLQEDGYSVRRIAALVSMSTSGTAKRLRG